MAFMSVGDTVRPWTGWRVVGLVAIGCAIGTALVLAAGLSPLWALAAGVAWGAAVVLLWPGAGDPAPSQAASAGAEGPARRVLDGRAALLIGALPDPCVIINRRGLIVLHNAPALEALPALRAGDPLSFVLRAPDVTEALSEGLATGRGAVVRYQEKVPLERWFEAHIRPLRLDGGTGPAAPDYVVVTLHELTNQQRLEQMRVDFVANASHELRTPLASLSGFIETLQGPARNDPTARERFLDIMRGQAVRMSRLIDDLLSLSRIELNEHVRPDDIIALGPIVAQTADALQPLAAENEVTLALALEASAPAVRADRDEIYRVCENLIENAIKYGAAGGRVEVTLAAAAAEDGMPAGTVLTVRDFGPGIADEHIPRLTERFYRVDTEASRAKGGTGLGLAIVKHIVARHRGRLAIESRIGDGTAVSVRLPAAEGDA